jgi:DNA-binding NtrC family response regulator
MATVIVVEDDTGTRQAYHDALEDAGHVVAAAADTQSALVLLRAASHRLVVLLDNVMPGMTGLDLLHLATGEAALARHAYVLVTASPHLAMHGLAQLGHGFRVDLLAKPFDLDVLLAMVDEAAQRLSGDEPDEAAGA